MPHIHTEPGQHDHTVTAYIVRTDTEEPKVMLHMHRKLHKLLPVGGHVELDETPWQAIAHELQEESGYDIATLDILQPISRIKEMEGVIFHPYPISTNTHTISDEHSHSDIQYAFIAHSDPTEAIDEGESIDIRWLTSKELNDLSEDMINANTRTVYRFILDEALETWERVAASRFER